MYGPGLPKASNAFYCSSSCMTTYYDSLIVSGDHNGNYNNISVTPSSDNDLADYQNGVSSKDAQSIFRHVQGIEYITDPFKMVSADVNNDHVIDSSDGESILDLILEDIPFDRNSWEWFNSQDIYDNWGSFTSNPYVWTLTYINSGSIFFTNVSTPQLTSSTTQPRYFYYNTTKVGEIDTVTNSLNDWICGSYSFKPKLDKSLFSKSGKIPNLNAMNKGETFELVISNGSDDTLYYSEIPLFINFKFLKISEVEINPRIPIQYKIKESKNEFVAASVCRKFEDAHRVKEGEQIIKIKLEAIQKVSDLNQVLSIHPLKNIEAGNCQFQDINLDVIINNFEHYHSNFELLKVSANSIYLNQDTNLEAQIKVYNLMGQLIASFSRNLNPGHNDIQFLDLEKSGYKIYQVNSNKGTIIFKSLN